MAVTASFYDRLGVDPGADVAALRRAYRERALQHHPDRAGGDAEAMAELNRAWAVLSDPGARARYDRSLPTPATPANPTRPPAYRTPTPPPATFSPHERGSRKAAWFAGIRLQVMRLGSEAIRSATQALSTRRGGRTRAVYEMYVDEVVRGLADETPERVRCAREAGAAPLDLGLASALIGVQEAADAVERRVVDFGLTERDVILAELLDKTWDNLAHGVSREVEMALGGNPRLLRTLTGRRR